MRFLIRELDYEQPIVSGRFRYERDGRPTGAVEEWRLAAAVDGYRFLRVDVDEREADSGFSTLYHLTLNAAGRPERLAYRRFKTGLGMSGNVLFETKNATHVHMTSGSRQESVILTPAGYLFGFTSAAGLGLLATGVDVGQEVAALILEASNDFGLSLVDLQREWRPEEVQAVAGKELSVRSFLIAWPGRQATLWLNEERRPVKVEWNGLSAVETRIIRYM